MCYTFPSRMKKKDIERNISYFYDHPYIDLYSFNNNAVKVQIKVYCCITLLTVLHVAQV